MAIRLRCSTAAVIFSLSDSASKGSFTRKPGIVSRLEMHFCGERPLLLSSTVREDNVLFAVDLTNPDLTMPSGAMLPRGTLHIYRTKFLTERIAYDQITLHNYGDVEVEGDLSFEFEGDFADIFEVRGEKRPKRGESLPEIVERSSVSLEYEGLDHIRRITRVECSACGMQRSRGRNHGAGAAGAAR